MVYNKNILCKVIASNSSKHFCRCLYSFPYEGFHTPVMAKEVLNSFEPKDGQVFIDMTFGSGGHTHQLLSSAKNTKIFALDRDPVSFSLAQQYAGKFPNRVIPLLGKFSDLPLLLKHYNVKPNSIDGILFDSGCSSMQFDSPERGFSLNKDGPLDMRMDGHRIRHSITAADVLARAEEYDLFKILKVYGEEKFSKKIARAIVEARYTFTRLETTKELADLVAAVCSTEIRLDKLQRPAHAATKTFQALRIFVNNEVNELNYGLLLANRYVKLGGKIVSLSFHSLEDRIVKRHLSGNVIDNAINPLPLKYTDHSVWHDEGSVVNLISSNWMPLYKHVLFPDSEEVAANPRSRSAKLRAAVKVK
ncbi:probable methyltransferase-like protein 15 homolog [Anabrus simplex]|uniref:probable methyltransferase-like protein 15 homolog n=1 Tax=Anabrus simplex TaxID=316456 RepID=UPI0034DD63B4